MQDKYAAPHLRMASVWTIMTAATQFKLEISFKKIKIKKRESSESEEKKRAKTFVDISLQTHKRAIYERISHRTFAKSTPDSRRNVCLFRTGQGYTARPCVFGKSYARGTLRFFFSFLHSTFLVLTSIRETTQCATLQRVIPPKQL